MEGYNAKVLLEDLIDLSLAKDITVDGNKAKVEDIHELYRERIIALADLLGVEEVYIDKLGQCEL